VIQNFNFNNTGIYTVTGINVTGTAAIYNILNNRIGSNDPIQSINSIGNNVFIGINNTNTGNITISATGAILPEGSQVGTQDIATADPNTGISTRYVPLYTQSSGLGTEAASFVFKSGNETGQLVFTTFTVSNGQNVINYNSGGTLFAF
jgi:hypothetical protein